jgi:uncharacterized membrane protein
MSDAPRRRTYLDRIRGVAVLIMIQAHVLDSWTRTDARATWQFQWATIVAGFGAPLFLFLAGTSVALAAGSRLRRTGAHKEAARGVMKRGVWLFLLALVFRVQAWILGQGRLRTLLKVDILNIMGPSIVAVAAMWGACRSARARVAAFAGTALALSLLTPIVRTTPLLDALPDPLEGYIRPLTGASIFLSNFCIFPWSGFVFAGAAVGVLIDCARAPEAERRLNAQLFAAGAALAGGAYAASYLPSPYTRSDFWGGSPAFFLIRTGLLIASVPIAYAWETVTSAVPWSPLARLGRNSLFIYWIHVEMVYGLISRPVHRALTHEQAWAAYALFVVFIFLCSLAKDRVTDWWKGRAIPPARAVAET